MEDGEWMRHIWDGPRPWPSVIYIETTNHCNAYCLCCLNHRCVKPRGIMSMETFQQVCAQVLKQGARIGAMFCFGEPLIDPTLFEKWAYAKKIGAMVPGHLGFNTNVSLLTPDKFEKICTVTNNITLSFYNIREEFERLTGGLSWDSCYKNATDFIRFRDRHFPRYSIAIGVNTIKGNNMAAVQEAFKNYKVHFVVDAEIRWGGSVITGVIDRSIMYNHWRCDGFKGALQVKWNGDCEFCAYDVIGTPRGGETLFGNILVDTWPELERKFKEKWQSGCSLCLRCDYWHRFKRVQDAGYCKRKGPDWYDWQKPFLKPGEEFID